MAVCPAGAGRVHGRHLAERQEQQAARIRGVHQRRLQSSLRAHRGSSPGEMRSVPAPSISPGAGSLLLPRCKPSLPLFYPQAAYLVGVSDPNSQAGQQGLVDPTQFARANQAIQMACQNLVDPACTQSQVGVRLGTTTAVFLPKRGVLESREVLRVLPHPALLPRCCQQPPSWPSTPRPCATRAAWPPPAPPTPWPSASSCSRPRRWPTARPTW